MKKKKFKKKSGKTKAIKKANYKFSDFLVKPLNFYFKNLHVALPLLIWLLILAASILVAGIILFGLLFKEIPLNTITQSQLLSPSLLKFFISLIIAIGVIVLIAVITSLFFTSSTFVFARNIVNGKREGRGFKLFLKKSFTYSHYWWKYALVKFLQMLIIAIGSAVIILLYVLITFLILFAFPKANTIFSIALGAILLIIGLLCYLFIAIPEYCLIYFNAGILESFKISVKIVKANYWQFLGLSIVLFLINIVGYLIFSFVYLGWLFNFLFFIQYKALVLMLFIKENSK